MKRFKHLWMTMFAAVLAVSILLGGVGLTSKLANASIDPIASEIIADLPATVYLGDEFTVANATVVDPTGVSKPITTSEVVKTKSLGNYVITYSDGGNEYVHTVHVKLHGEYQLRVKDNGADIPTVTTVGEGKQALPEAFLYYKDADMDDFEKVDAAKYTVKTYINNEIVEKGAKYTLTPGMHYVQYVANIKDTEVHYSKDFTIKAQNNFEDKSAPSLSLNSTIPQTASVGTKVTLPQALVDSVDNFDKNVRIEITVTLDGKAVKVVTPDKYGYGDVVGAEDVVFDNAFMRSFYPMEVGTYIVTYQAFDDAGNKTIKDTKSLVVKDTTAPKLEEIKDSQIPATWSETIKKAEVDEDNNIINGTDGKPKSTDADKFINFPYPVYSDNSGSEGIKVSFTITDKTDSNKSQTVIKFDNIYDVKDGIDGSGRQYKYSSTGSNGIYKSDNADEVFTFDGEGFKFYISNYLNNVTDKASRYGTYTAVYRASDAAGISSTTTYTFTITNSKVEDLVKPTVDLTVDDYLYVTDEHKDYILPSALINDAKDTKPTVLYTVKGSASVDAITVENGATIKINTDSIIYDDETFEYDGDLVITVKATDNVGNFKDETKIIPVSRKADFADANIELKIDETLNAIPVDGFTAGNPINIGTFRVSSFSKEFRDFSGVEVLLKDPSGATLDGISFEYAVIYDGGTTSHSDAAENTKNGCIELKDVSFVPQDATVDKDGQDIPDKSYVLTIRAFDISGRSVIESYEITGVKPHKSGTGSVSAGSLPIKGNIREAYKFPYSTANNVDLGLLDKRSLVRKVSGAGNFSIMGNELTSYSASTYNFIDGYISGGEFVHASKSNPFVVDSYSFTATDKTSPIFEVLGYMPTYLEKDVPYTLPIVIAYGEYTNSEVEVVIKENKNNDSDLVVVNHDTTNNRWEFIPSLDAVYTVTYSAKGSDASQSFTIKVGDIVAPEISIDETTKSYTSSMTQKKTFSFAQLIYDQNKNADELKDVTIKKQLFDPSNTLVYSVEGMGKTAGLEATQKDGTDYTFDKSGPYKVVYTATDKHGNDFEIQEIIDITKSEGVNPVPLKVLRTVLIILGVVLLGCAALYFVRYRKVKTNKK